MDWGFFLFATVFGCVARWIASKAVYDRYKKLHDGKPYPQELMGGMHVFRFIVYMIVVIILYIMQAVYSD